MFNPAGRSRLGLWVGVVAGVLCLTGAALARDVQLTMQDGRVFKGELVSEDEKTVIIKISGIPTPWQRTDIKNIQYLLSMEEQYRQKRSQIQDSDVDARYALAKWLYENKEFKLAQQELESLAKNFPNDARVSQLLQIVNDLIKLSEQPQTAPNPRNPNNPNTITPPPTVQPPANSKLPTNRLGDKEINLIRLYEVQIPPEKPNVVIDNAVMNEAFRKYTTDDRVPKTAELQQRALGLDGWAKLRLLFDVQAKDLWLKATVLNDVASVANYRQNVQNSYVLNYCGSNQCHGGENAGDFFLFRKDPSSDATVYTNFYILSRYKDDKGFMVDRDLPRRSYLVQYALPTATAIYPHPDVPGWKPLLATDRDQRAQDVVNWITSLPKPAPTLTLNYTIPTMPSKRPPAPPVPPATPAPQN